MSNFVDFFRNATASQFGEMPYPYQVRLAESPITTRTLKAPTGAGKTAAAILSWLYRRKIRAGDAPTRLVYCLPMRVLVEQTIRDTRDWVARVAPHVEVAPLMGGDVDEKWAIYPEKPMILVGTQDMLLSRALNRGYALSRYRWPWIFGLLNNDCLWVCDEVQLMGDGLATTTQLSAFRELFGTFGNCPTLWMSATMDAAMLSTVDVTTAPDEISLCNADLSPDRGLYKRVHAKKAIQKAPDGCRTPAGLARFLVDQHQPGTQTLAVVNRVPRAREVFDEVKRLAPGLALLLHSRFRPAEKRNWPELLREKPSGEGRIVIATQVVEAGVDMSSALLVTDLAPWPSLVQRFGRCNRSGECVEGANIYWVDRPVHSKVKLPLDAKLTDEIALPYSVLELQDAENVVAKLCSASPADLPPRRMAYKPSHVLRRRDLIDLFDTTPDLSGYDLDISRFIRDANSRDVLIAWRSDFPPVSEDDAPARDELCAVSITDVAPLLKPLRRGVLAFPLLTWNPLKKKWDELKSEDALRPGVVLVTSAKAGRYDRERGWDPSNDKKAFADPGKETSKEEAYDDDRLTFQNYTQSLAAHCHEVRVAMAGILDGLAATGIDLASYREQLLCAALHHDWGKIHDVFQRTVNPQCGSIPLAKSQTNGRHERRHFRHELASALALLQSGAPDLVVYLAAAHHGKVRVSIRALPDEDAPTTVGTRFARGIWEGDMLPSIELDGTLKPAITLDLEVMQMGLSAAGSPSWMERMLGLRDEFGPFRLAYLEGLISAADWRASGDAKDML